MILKLNAVFAEAEKRLDGQRLSEHTRKRGGRTAPDGLLAALVLFIVFAAICGAVLLFYLLQIYHFVN